MTKIKKHVTSIAIFDAEVRKLRAQGDDSEVFTSFNDDAPATTVIKIPAPKSLRGGLLRGINRKKTLLP